MGYNLKLLLHNGDFKSIETNFPIEYWERYGCFADQDHGKTICPLCVKEVFVTTYTEEV